MFLVNCEYRHFGAIFDQHFWYFLFRIVLEEWLDPLDRDVEDQHGLLKPVQEGVAAGLDTAETKVDANNKPILIVVSEQ